MSTQKPRSAFTYTRFSPLTINDPSVVSMKVLSKCIGTSTSTGFSYPGSPVPLTKNLPSVVSTVNMSSSVGTCTSNIGAVLSLEPPLIKNLPSVVSTVTWSSCVCSSISTVVSISTPSTVFMYNSLLPLTCIAPSFVSIVT